MKRSKVSGNVSIEKLPLPTFSDNLSEDTLQKAKQIFYRNDVRMCAWYLRLEYKIPGFSDDAALTDVDHEQLRKIYEDPKFHLNYKALMAILPIDTYKRWEPCFREFVFYNRVGDILPKQGANDTTGSFEISEGVDVYGEFVQVRVYNKIDKSQWKDNQQHADKRLRRFGKWKTKGHDLDLLVRLAGLRRLNPTLSFSDLAGQLELQYPELSTKANGYNDNDISKMLAIAHELGF